MNTSGISRKLLALTNVNVGPNLCTSLFGKATLGLQMSRNLVTSSSKLCDKTKFPGNGSGGNGIVDSDGYSLDLDEKGQQKLEKFKKVIEKNTYYDKYKTKIVETQK